MVRMVALFSLFSVVTACSSSKGGTRATPPGHTVAEYFPLKVGDTWLYETVAGPKKETMRYQVMEQKSDHAFLLQVQPGGEQTSPTSKAGRALMELRPRGVFDGTRYILTEPMVQGTHWTAILDARTAEKFEVSSTTADADVPAGKFDHCALVHESIKEPGEVLMATDTTYCRGVGMVESVVHISKPGKKTLEMGHLRLMTYESGGVRVVPKKFGE